MALISACSAAAMSLSKLSPTTRQSLGFNLNCFKTNSKNGRLGLIKTDRPFLELVLKQLRLNPKDCLVVGDSLESDIAAAEQAEIKAILVDRKGTRSYGHKIKNLNEL